jgi:hypothetical protein
MYFVRASNRCSAFWGECPVLSNQGVSPKITPLCVLGPFFYHHLLVTRFSLPTCDFLSLDSSSNEDLLVCPHGASKIRFYPSISLWLRFGLTLPSSRNDLPSDFQWECVGLRPLGCCGRGFKSRSEHGCLYVVLSCVCRGLCDGLITRPEESYRVSVCVWSIKCQYVIEENLSSEESPNKKFFV